MRPGLLLISGDAWDAAFAQELARAVGGSCSVAATVDEGLSAARAQPFQHVFVDASREEASRDFLAAFKGYGSPMHFISSQQLHEAPHLARLRGNLTRFVYRGELDAREDAALYASFALGAETPFLDEGAFKVKTLGSSAQKGAALDELARDLEKASVGSTLRSIICTAADELLMNAIFDAPVTSDGRPAHAETPRNSAIMLDGRASVTFKYAVQGDWVCVRARDQYGSLSPDRVLTKIGANFSRKAYKSGKDLAGAGLGLHFICRNGGSLVLDHERGSHTEASAIFKTRAPHNARRFRFVFIGPRPRE